MLLVPLNWVLLFPLNVIRCTLGWAGECLAADFHMESEEISALRRAFDEGAETCSHVVGGDSQGGTQGELLVATFCFEPEAGFARDRVSFGLPEQTSHSRR